MSLATWISSLLGCVRAAACNRRCWHREFSSFRLRGCLPTACALPPKRDFGASRWQLLINPIYHFVRDKSMSGCGPFRRSPHRRKSVDHRLNHWAAVRDALVSAHADLFPQIPAIVNTLPDPIDQMKLFELIQIIPTPTRAALKSGNLTNYKISDPRIMGYLRNNSIFTFGQADRAKKSATFREILDAMWLFNNKFERALSKFNEIRVRR